MNRLGVRSTLSDFDAVGGWRREAALYLACALTTLACGWLLPLG
jgi:hypothetical protein